MRPYSSMRELLTFSLGLWFFVGRGYSGYYVTRVIMMCVGICLFTVVEVRTWISRLMLFAMPLVVERAKLACHSVENQLRTTLGVRRGANTASLAASEIHTLGAPQRAPVLLVLDLHQSRNCTAV